METIVIRPINVSEVDGHSQFSYSIFILGIQIDVSFRYSSMEKFHDTIKNQFNATYPNFPKTHFFSRKSAKTLQERFEKFEGFLNWVFSFPAIYHSQLPWLTLNIPFEISNTYMYVSSPLDSSKLYSFGLVIDHCWDIPHLFFDRILSSFIQNLKFGQDIYSHLIPIRILQRLIENTNLETKHLSVISDCFSTILDRLPPPSFSLPHPSDEPTFKAIIALFQSMLISPHQNFFIGQLYLLLPFIGSETAIKIAPDYFSDKTLIQPTDFKRLSQASFGGANVRSPLESKEVWTSHAVVRALNNITNSPLIRESLAQSEYIDELLFTLLVSASPNVQVGAMLPALSILSSKHSISTKFSNLKATFRATISRLPHLTNLLAVASPDEFDMSTSSNAASIISIAATGNLSKNVNWNEVFNILGHHNLREPVGTFPRTDTRFAALNNADTPAFTRPSHSIPPVSPSRASNLQEELFMSTTHPALRLVSIIFAMIMESRQENYELCLHFDAIHNTSLALLTALSNVQTCKFQVDSEQFNQFKHIMISAGLHDLYIKCAINSSGYENIDQSLKGLIAFYLCIVKEDFKSVASKTLPLNEIVEFPNALFVDDLKLNSSDLLLNSLPLESLLNNISFKSSKINVIHNDAFLYDERIYFKIIQLSLQLLKNVQSQNHTLRESVSLLSSKFAPVADVLKISDERIQNLSLLKDRFLDFTPEEIEISIEKLEKEIYALTDEIPNILSLSESATLADQEDFNLRQLLRKAVSQRDTCTNQISSLKTNTKNMENAIFTLTNTRQKRKYDLDIEIGVSVASYFPSGFDDRFVLSMRQIDIWRHIIESSSNSIQILENHPTSENVISVMSQMAIRFGYAKGAISVPPEPIKKFRAPANNVIGQYEDWTAYDIESQKIRLSNVAKFFSQNSINDSELSAWKFLLDSINNEESDVKRSTNELDKLFKQIKNIESDITEAMKFDISQAASKYNKFHKYCFENLISSCNLNESYQSSILKLYHSCINSCQNSNEIENCEHETDISQIYHNIILESLSHCRFLERKVVEITRSSSMNQAKILFTFEHILESWLNCSSSPKHFSSSSSINILIDSISRVKYDAQEALRSSKHAHLYYKQLENLVKWTEASLNMIKKEVESIQSDKETLNKSSKNKTRIESFDTFISSFSSYSSGTASLNILNDLALKAKLKNLKEMGQNLQYNCLDKYKDSVIFSCNEFYDGMKFAIVRRISQLENFEAELMNLAVKLSSFVIEEHKKASAYTSRHSRDSHPSSHHRISPPSPDIPYSNPLENPNFSHTIPPATELLAKVRNELEKAEAQLLTAEFIFDQVEEYNAKNQIRNHFHDLVRGWPNSISFKNSQVIQIEGEIDKILQTIKTHESSITNNNKQQSEAERRLANVCQPHVDESERNLNEYQAHFNQKVSPYNQSVINWLNQRILLKTTTRNLLVPTVKAAFTAIGWEGVIGAEAGQQLLTDMGMDSFMEIIKMIDKS